MRDRGAHCDSMTEAECDALDEFGYQPTVHAYNREVKGTKDGDKHYLSADELRHLGSALVKLATWLDERAATHHE